MCPQKKIKRILRVGLAEDSGLASFVERPVPTDKELAGFERAVKREASEQEIDNRLSEIYLDKRGRKIDVRTMTIKKKANWFWRFFKKIFWLVVIASLVYYGYSYWRGGGSDVSALEFQITGPEQIVAGEDFFYLVSYHNPTKFILTKIRLELQYPVNFIFDSATITPTSGDYGWDLLDLAPGASGTLEIKGKLIGTPEAVNVIFGNLSYLPGTLTSRFKKEASASTVINGSGFRIDLVYSQTAFVNQENEMSLVLSDVQNNYLGDFDLSFSLPAEANASVTATTSPVIISSEASSTKPLITKNGGNSWRISNLLTGAGRQEIPLVYIVKNKLDNQTISVRLEKKLAEGESYIFWEKSFNPQLVSSDLNLTILLGDSKSDSAVNFGDTLNYTLTYANAGAVAYQDVTVMAVLDSDFIDWNSLNDEYKGQLAGRSIIWTKNEIPALAEIKPGVKGELSFQVKLQKFKESDFGKNLTLISYAQYGINKNAVRGQSNRSNTLTSRINSNLELNESIRYFNEDNLPVGAGPLPPQVDIKTSFKVYWTIKNSLHELTDTKVVFTLPDKVVWEEGGATNVGSVYYQAATRQVIWEIGRLPVSVTRADAEFSLSVTPEIDDRGKILILSAGSTVSATDTETKQTLTRRTTGKTTKLEDDDIASLNNSGIVQ